MYLYIVVSYCIDWLNGYPVLPGPGGTKDEGCRDGLHPPRALSPVGKEDKADTD